MWFEIGIAIAIVVEGWLFLIAVNEIVGYLASRRALAAEVLPKS